MCFSTSTANFRQIRTTKLCSKQSQHANLYQLNIKFDYKQTMSHYRVINSKIMNIIFCPYEEQYDHGKEPRGQLQKKGVQVFFKK